MVTHSRMAEEWLSAGNFPLAVAAGVKKDPKEMHMSTSLKDRLRRAMNLSDDASDDDITDSLASEWGERDTLARFRQAVVDALPLADAQDADEQLIGQLRDHVDTRAAMQQDERARLAKEIMVAAVPRIWPDRKWAPGIDSEDAVALTDALLAALRKPQEDSQRYLDEMGRAQSDAARLRTMLERVTQHLEDAVDLIEEDGLGPDDDVDDERTLIAEARALLLA